MRCALLALPVLFLAIGCAEKRTFQLAVRNETGRPLTVGVTKDGGSFERQWAAPEQAVLRTTGEDERAWDSVVIAPGQVGSAGPITGDFSGGAAAILRVYSGDLELSDVLAISRRSPERVDVPLAPGRNAIIIREEKGRLAYERVPVPAAGSKGN
jgi:hypothetical protein